VGFVLIFATALLGRVWCGWACPQTVFLDGVYRRVERWINGPREVRIRRAASPDGFHKVWRIAATHGSYVAISFVIAHIVLSYFTSMPGLLVMVRGNPSAHPEAFAWAAAITGVLYFDLGYFREQVCLAICPYGRLQSVLIDADSLAIGYDAGRGEPRGKVSDPNAGACVECKRCVVVCPTGIDIRNGLQVDCIACTACIDACDQVMDKLGRPRGLIRYASTRALLGGATRFVRPRMLIYCGLGLAGIVAATLAFRTHEAFEANLLRLPGAPYVFDGGNVRDSFEVHVVNKTAEAHVYAISVEADSSAAQFVLPIAALRLAPMSDQRVPLFVTEATAQYHGDFAVRVHVTADGATPAHVVSARFLGSMGGS
jgi:polyferredoxin